MPAERRDSERRTLLTKQPFVVWFLGIAAIISALTVTLAFVEDYRPWPKHSELQKVAVNTYEMAISYWSDRQLQLRVHLGEAKRNNDLSTERLIQRDLLEIEEKIKTFRGELRGIR